eukprot:TRINITY_DN5589_c1_g1_i1.p1 TRINITY_DN5589_c1_g1~~TRINITY_DN5589_c1_g1_i1.p1  ORF type:complete len:594 (+),score=175.36 TRINITY_DN5589_c1_g1_i1:31-1812(+)
MQADVRSDVAVLRVRRTLEPVEKTADDAVLTEVWECMRPKLTNTMLNTLRNVLFFSHATNIQRLTIPTFCREGSSVMVEASTGSGKTLSFLLPVLHRLAKHNEKSISETGLPILSKHISAIVLSPNKTLSRQTFSVCRQLIFGAEHNIKAVIWGDTKVKPEKEVQKFNKMPRGGGTIVVTTLHAMLAVLKWCKEKKNKSITFSETPLVVLDEADVILDKHRPLLDEVLSYFPKKMYFGLFGATVTSTSSVAEFIADKSLSLMDVPAYITDNASVPVERDDEDKIIDKPDIIEDPLLHEGKIYRIVDKQSTLINLRNCHMFVPAKQSMSMLIHLLNKHPKKKHFIFFNNSETLEYAEEVLKLVSANPEHGILWQLTPYALHQGMSEARRSMRFQEFLHDEKGVLLSTDVCAFGIDVREVDYVLHFQPPTDTRVYTHRIGRTGRMGCVGTSVLLLPLELKESLGPFIDELQNVFKSEDYRYPAGAYDATPLISDLMTDRTINELVTKAAFSLMKTHSGAALTVALCALGIDEELAHQMTEAKEQELIDEQEKQKEQEKEQEKELETTKKAKKRSISKGGPVSKKQKVIKKKVNKK